MALSHGAKKDRKRELAIAALLVAGSIHEAAAQAGISESTLDEWLRDPEFSADYARARRRVLDGVIGKLQQAASAAVEALTRNLNCGTASVEVRAAEAILTHTFRGVEITDLAVRLEEVERLLTPDVEVQLG